MRETPCAIKVTHYPHTFVPMESADQQVEKCPGFIASPDSRPLWATTCGTFTRHDPHLLNEPNAHGFCVGHSFSYNDDAED
jgi:hypothetical protein